MTRVVSLLPAATEIVAALGGIDMLVGISHECDYPTAVTGRPRVTRSAIDARAAAAEVDAQVRALSRRGEPLYDLDEVRIAQLEPDLILTQAVCDVCAVSEGDVRALAVRLAHSPRVVTLSATSLAGVLADITLTGTALELAGEAEELCAGIRLRLRAVHDALARAEAPRPRVAIVEWTDPIFIAGHWVPELIQRAGGCDALAEPGQHSRVATIHELRRAHADIHVIAPCGYDLPRAETVARSLIARDEWSWALTTPVWVIDANALTSRPGPRFARGVEILARILHPALFGDPSSDLAMRIC